MKQRTGLLLVVGALLMVPNVASASDQWRSHRGPVRAEIRREIRQAVRDAQRARIRAGRDVRWALAWDRRVARQAIRAARRDMRFAVRDARRAARDARRRMWWD